jgi:predicted DCC family thiol-disulfide oxidoreductase YuxK
MTAVLLYDGTSGFCSICARGIQRWVRPACVVVPYQRVDLAGWHLTVEHADADVILARRIFDVVLIDTGLDALIEALASGRGGWRAAARLLRVRPVRPVAETGYRWAMANRHRLSFGVPASDLDGTSQTLPAG